MTAERIQEAILAEAQAEAEKILAAARERVQADLTSAQRRIDDEMESQFERARQQAEQEARRRVMEVRTRYRMEALERRNAIVNDVFEKAAKRLRALPDEEYAALVGGWLAEASVERAADVLCHERDAARLEPLIAKLNEERSAESALSLAPGDEPQGGGVIVRADQFEMDLSVASRAARVREDIMPQVAGVLFRANT